MLFMWHRNRVCYTSKNIPENVNTTLRYIPTPHGPLYEGDVFILKDLALIIITIIIIMLQVHGVLNSAFCFISKIPVIVS